MVDPILAIEEKLRNHPGVLVERGEGFIRVLPLGLSDQARLCVVSRGGFDHKWTLESWDGAAWVPDSTPGLLIFPFWKRRLEAQRAATAGRSAT